MSRRGTIKSVHKCQGKYSASYVFFVGPRGNQLIGLRPLIRSGIRNVSAIPVGWNDRMVGLERRISVRVDVFMRVTSRIWGQGSVRGMQLNRIPDDFMRARATVDSRMVMCQVVI